MIKRKSLTKALAITLSVALIGSSLQTSGSVVMAAEQTTEITTETNTESTDVEESKDSEMENSEVEKTDEENSDVSESSENQTSESEKDEVETTSTEEEKTESVESTAEEKTTEEATTEEETTEEVSVMGMNDAPYTVVVSQGTDGYDNFTSDKTIATFNFATDVTTDTVYNADAGYGFSDVDFNTDADGWVSGVYNPRKANVTASKASNVSYSNDGMLAINSKVWTETESTGYGVYTYENTSTFDIDVYNADYTVEVTFENPTGGEYTAYVEAEDITRVSDITVGAGKSVTATAKACVVDGQLNLKFLGKSSATSISDAATSTVYVSKVKVVRNATNELGSKPTLFIASDSTVQTYEKNYYPQTGWDRP